MELKSLVIAVLMHFIVLRNVEILIGIIMIDSLVGKDTII